MKRASELKRTPFPGPLAEDGRRSSLPARRTGLRSARLAVIERDGAVVLAPRQWQRQRKDTGFSPAVKLAVRKRAGGGEIEQARCECCGCWLGRYGGQVQHVVARGMGGTSNPVLSTAANGALLCGTAQSGDHGLAESRDPEMRRRGFWLPQGTDPRLVPMILWSGVRARRSEDGGYLYEAPDGGAA